MTMVPRAPHRSMLALELWFARKLGQPGLFSGMTTAAERRERIRRAIVAEHWENEVIGHKAGLPMTYAQAYDGAFGESIDETADA